MKKYKIIGGNSGYDGYSMSWRAREARCDGRFPKVAFRSYYNITENSFKILVELRIINDNEWHHTGCYGRRTIFYSWVLPDYRVIYIQNKQLIDRLSREGKQMEIDSIFRKR